MSASADWYVAYCSECGQSFGGFDSEELADSFILGEQLNCSSCEVAFSRNHTGQRWNYRVQQMPRPTRRGAPLARVVQLDPAVSARLAGTLPYGPLILGDIEELNAAAQGGLASATLCLWGKVLDGAIKLRGRVEGWWNADWDEKTLGWVLSEKNPVYPHLSKLAPDGLLDRLRDKTKYLRNSGAHQNYTRVSDVEAYGAIEALSEFLSTWL